MGKIGTFEIILILAIALLLFGGKKIPDLMKGLGKGIRGFKEEMKGGEEDETKPGASSENK
jgi:sec-independent protein translocase protein TatA